MFGTEWRNRGGGAKARLALALVASLAGASAARGQAVVSDAPPEGQGEAPATPEDFSIHGQFTNVTQFHPAFRSPYRGPNSLDPGNRGDETVDATLFAGVRLWDTGEFYANPEIDQGLGLSNTLGVAGFPSGEAYKIGSAHPYLRLPRAFLRQTFDLGGEVQAVQPGANQLGGTRSADNLVVTVGKFSVTDIFDVNSYAHDPRADFLNWAIIDGGAFDYAADAWGYTYGAAVEWTQSWWTLRTGLFDLSREPNSKFLQRNFSEFSAISELEGRYELLGQPGKIKLLGFVNYGRMAQYEDAIRAAAGTGAPPDVANVRRWDTRPGGEINVEQQLTADLGLFARISANDGSKEAYEFTEINRSVSLGASMKGTRWNRPDDTLGMAGVINDISGDARRYLAAGGLGILIGDGRLPHYGFEKIAEVYYSLAVTDGVSLAADYQFIDNPAYNADRGPVSVFGGRIHLEF